MNKDAKILKPLKSLNAPIYKWGLSPLQFSLVILLTVFSLFANIFFAFFFLFLVFLLTRKIKNENSNGNPDYLGSLVRNFGLPKYYEDKSKVMNYLINDDE